MDFIEHDPTSHPIIPSFDLDPFDMLGEFSELDQYGGKITYIVGSRGASQLGGSLLGIPLGYKAN